MIHLSCRHILRQWILLVVTGGPLIFGSISTADDAVTPDDKRSEVEKARPGPVGLAVSGATAGITTDYLEQAVTDALKASGVFSGIDNSKSAEVVMPMIRAEGTFSSMENSGNAPFFLTVRVIKVETQSFSIKKTVSMNAIWTLYRTAEEIELLNEDIYSIYTGGVLEGGLHGANRVRVAMEGAARQNVRIGIGMLESLDLEQDINQVEQLETGQASSVE